MAVRDPPTKAFRSEHQKIESVLARRMPVLKAFNFSNFPKTTTDVRKRKNLRPSVVFGFVRLEKLVFWGPSLQRLAG